MGSKFIERHRRKSLLAALLLLFRGRARYAVLLVMVLGASAPFVVSRDMLYRLAQSAPVSYILRATGLGGVITSPGSSHSNDILKAAMERARRESGRDPVWNNFLRGRSGAMAGSGSSLAMLRGGEDLYRSGDGGGKGKGGGADSVKGAVSDADKARGQGADAVDFESYLADASGGAGSGFGYMEGSGSFGGALGANSPFMNRTLLGGGRGAGGAAEGMYGGAMDQAAGKVPVAGTPKPVSGRRMGRVSGFSWRNAGYRQDGGGPGSRISKQGAMFRLAETFTMTAAAYRNSKASSEYQASYVGSTYDGNAVGLEEIQTDVTLPEIPDNSWTSGLMQGVAGLVERTERCNKAVSEMTPQITKNAEKIAEISKRMGGPPRCCKKSAVNRWNGQVDGIKALCKANNALNERVSNACSVAPEPVNCNSHDGTKIRRCSKWKCWAGVILGVGLILLGPMFLPLGLLVLIGQIWGEKYSWAGKLRYLSSSVGPEDGSSALDDD